MTQPERVPSSDRPTVFRGGTVLTMDAASTVLTDACPLGDAVARGTSCR